MPPTGLLPRLTVTAPVKLRSVLPSESRAASCTAGVMIWPSTSPLGCTGKASWPVGVPPSVAMPRTPVAVGPMHAVHTTGAAMTADHVGRLKPPLHNTRPREPALHG